MTRNQILIMWNSCENHENRHHVWTNGANPAGAPQKLQLWHPSLSLLFSSLYLERCLLGSCPLPPSWAHKNKDTFSVAKTRTFFGIQQCCVCECGAEIQPNLSNIQHLTTVVGNPLETTGEQEQFGSSPAMKVCHVLRSPGSTLICLPVAILVSKQNMRLGCRTKRWTSLSLCHSRKSFWHIVAVVYMMEELRRLPTSFLSAFCEERRPTVVSLGHGARWESLPQGRPQRSNGATTWCRVPRLNAVVLAECMHSTFLCKNPCSATDKIQSQHWWSIHANLNPIAAANVDSSQSTSHLLWL